MREEQAPQVEAPTRLPREPRRNVFAGEGALGRAPASGRPTDAEGESPLFAEEPVAGSSPARRVPSAEEPPLFADEDDLVWNKRWWWSSRHAAPALLLGAVLLMIALGAFPRNAPRLRPPNPDMAPADTSTPLSQPNVPARLTPLSPAAEDQPIPVTPPRDVPADVKPSIERVASPAGDPPTSPREDPPALRALEGLPAIAGTTIPIAPPPYSGELRSDPGGAEPTTEATPAPVDETAGVREVLARYVAAYAALDAGGVAAVWPTVDQPALGRAFESLQSQSISFSRCSVTVSGATARAMCAGTVVWSPRIGGTRSREDERTWTFSLTQRDDSWAIVSAEVR
jgi:hypothetical protein